ncbi:hypothetical protein SARC_08919 [Sphaeroforma arctica JP610]|uniref:protein-tyrosine-phosphatase n=1 Tax=Sphaeroforma arctica JP610 TaxID=667725 RepID=A0A0L0FQ60_9EUKA|nr:hypothetical protein SARC_08919 [Sphaeroforma arctica JP610]KNC78661.1 hypothetical protein SARC_08919 [Sphaeroforma arctica JP610]|eukprot:XP_014152563.1 hypothetical protein SARC_08919 [Sphaeroforma arctica JP610]
MLLTMMLALCAKKKQRLPPPKTVPLSEVVSQGGTANQPTETAPLAIQTVPAARKEEPLPPIPVESAGENDPKAPPESKGDTYMQTYSFSSIKRELFEEKILKMKQRQGFFSEFDRIESEEEKFGDQLTASTAATNAGSIKNRYTNIIAKDWSRVKLKDREENEDYINANYIHGYKQKKAYIAAQAPTEACLVDFWSMVWQENVKVIVMVAQLMEGTSEKCTRYWPLSQGEEIEHGDFKITYVRDDDIQDESYTRRLLEVVDQRDGVTRTVWHLHYESWPDHGIPGTEDTIYTVLKDMNNLRATEEPTESAPVVVHCSAGVGRSGVMICLDIAIKQMENDGMADIYNIVLDLRKHRAGMVQRSKQYEYCYEALLEYIKRNGRTEATSAMESQSVGQESEDVTHTTNNNESKDGAGNADVAVTGGDVVSSDAKGKGKMKMEPCLD